jgi:DNA-binding transcriptional LysR family regulator
MVQASRISLDQWRVLVAVVDAGGYAQAAELLHKSQSTLTYAVQKLESLLGVRVFAIEGRRAVLTPVGRVLYRRGKALTEQALSLERAAVSLAAGWEPELRLAVEAIESVLGGTDEALLEGRADLVIGSAVPPGFLADPLMHVRFVAAAHPEHPLHTLGRALTLEDLGQFRHLVIRDTGRQRDRTPGWLNERRWTVSDKTTSIRAACMGLGYAWYPEEVIRDELVSGALKPLPLVEGSERWAMLYLIFADRDAAGPGTERVAQLIREAVRLRCPENVPV